MTEQELYIHIPFCARRCAYCDFLSSTGPELVRRAYGKALTAELDALDAQRLVDTVNGLTGELEKAQLADTLDSLRTISAQLEKVDWAALEQSTGNMLAQAQKSLAAAEEALTAVNDAAEKLDVEGLNTAVTELLAVMQPLAEFFARFK